MDQQTALILTSNDPIGVAATLDLKKSVAKALVDRAAEQAAQQFITPGDRQMATYLKKQSEAEKWAAEIAASQTPIPTNYPLLKRRAERLNPTTPDYQAVADEWNLQAAAWDDANGEIEDQREGAKEAIDAASDEAAIRSAMTAISWPLPGP